MQTKQPTLQCSKEYHRFKLHQFNRDIKRSKALEKSMKEHGFIPAYPIHCKYDDETGDLYIIAGHHRFETAKKLAIPFYYVVFETNATIHELENATRKWDSSDYLTTFVRQGLIDYIEVQEYVERTKISIAQAMSMLGGELATSHNLKERFKSGKFKVRPDNHAETVAIIVTTLQQLGIDFAAKSKVVASLSRIALAGHADISQFLHRIKTHHAHIKEQASTDEYMKMWEEIYNRSSKGKRTPLVLLTEDTIKEKANSFGKTK